MSSRYTSDTAARIKCMHDESKCIFYIDDLTEMKFIIIKCLTEKPANMKRQ